MTTYFITRHPGALDWAREEGVHVDQQLIHFDPAILEAGDVVIGSLPVNLAFDVCQRGGRYLHLALDLPADWRGKELSAKDMHRFGARLEEYCVTRTPKANSS